MRKMAAEKEIKKNRINREIKFRLIKFRLRARSITSPPPPPPPPHRFTVLHSARAREVTAGI
jgi:hypothetical protein